MGFKCDMCGQFTEHCLCDGEALVARGFSLILEGLGLDLEDPHVKDTPERAARAWYRELCSGLTGGEPNITVFPSEENVNGMIILRDIPVKSLCSHHLLPFIGRAVVGYIPGGDHILGLSKLSRIVNHWSRRPQVQERLTQQIADDLWERVGGEQIQIEHQEFFTQHPEWVTPADQNYSGVPLQYLWQGGVGVIIRARHMCMELRGVNHASDMMTSALRGKFLNEPQVRAEFLKLAGDL